MVTIIKTNSKNYFNIIQKYLINKNSSSPHGSLTALHHFYIVTSSPIAILFILGGRNTKARRGKD